MGQININIRMDEGLKLQAESLFSELGMNMSTAFNVFVRQAVRQRGIPFEITAAPDGFFNSYNQQRLAKTIENYDNKSKVIVKTMEELEAMADE